jgi:post-segregation antitoxin (ccd killing protein)
VGSNPTPSAKSIAAATTRLRGCEPSSCLRMRVYTRRMPSRTIYLPDDVNQMVDDLDVNLSRITQEAVRALAEQRAANQNSRLAEIRLKVKTADLAYPKDHLRDTRREAGDDLR